MSKWQSLQAYHASVATRPLISLFDETDRAADFSVSADQMMLDYSKANIDSKTKDLLIDLAKVSGVAEKRVAMFRAKRSMTPRAAPCCTPPCGRGQRQ